MTTPTTHDFQNFQFVEEWVPPTPVEPLDRRDEPADPPATSAEPNPLTTNIQYCQELP
jgi:hypothetical protein